MLQASRERFRRAHARTRVAAPHLRLEIPTERFAEQTATSEKILGSEYRGGRTPAVCTGVEDRGMIMLLVACATRHTAERQLGGRPLPSQKGSKPASETAGISGSDRCETRGHQVISRQATAAFWCPGSDAPITAAGSAPVSGPSAVSEPGRLIVSHAVRAPLRSGLRSPPFADALQRCERRSQPASLPTRPADWPYDRRLAAGAGAGRPPQG